jgi:hypothetical protein
MGVLPKSEKGEIRVHELKVIGGFQAFRRGCTRDGCSPGFGQHALKSPTVAGGARIQTFQATLNV